MLIARIKHIDDANPVTLREHTQVVLVSLDPERDSLHSPIVAVLDREGVIAARLENAADDVAPLLSALERSARLDGALER